VTVAVQIEAPSLTDAEYAYAVTKAGEDVWERAYGLVYTR